MLSHRTIDWSADICAIQRVIRDYCQPVQLNRINTLWQAVLHFLYLVFYLSLFLFRNLPKLKISEQFSPPCLWLTGLIKQDKRFPIKTRHWWGCVSDTGCFILKRSTQQKWRMLTLKTRKCWDQHSQTGTALFYSSTEALSQVFQLDGCVKALSSNKRVGSSTHYSPVTVL